MSAPELPGLDLERLGPWLAEHVPGAGASLPDASSPGSAGPAPGSTGWSARHVAGGKSNLTYEVGDGTMTWIVRRPPLGHVLATAHDMAREHRVMTALRETAVPVPITYALCEDEAVLGAPFYVMERVEGTPYRQARELAALGEERTRSICEQLIDTLALLHTVDPASVGLADFGRPEGFLTRQVVRWKKQLDASYSRDLPDADALHARLSERVAEVDSAGSPGIVHGDYRLDNVLIDRDDVIRAVVDWEMATLGDPLTDLAVMVLYQRMADLVDDVGVTDVSKAPGYLDEAGLLARYQSAGGRRLDHFGFYLGLAAFKLATILEGIHYRHLHGQTVGAGFDRIGEAIHPLLAAGLAAVKED